MDKITNSYVYQSMDGGTTEKIGTLIKSKELITPDNCDGLHYVLSTSPKLLIDPAGMKKAINSGLIRIVYEPHVSIGRSVSFIPVGEGNNAMCIINGNTFFKVDSTVGAEGTVNKYRENNSNLHAIIELLNMAHVVLTTAKNPLYLYNNIAIREITFELYQGMVTDSLSRLTSLNSNPVGMSITKILFSCMLLKRMGLKDIRKAADYFINKEGLEDVHANILIQQITDESLENIDTVLVEVKKNIPQMSKVDLPALIATYTTIFTPMAPISIDYAPYLAGLIVSGATGSITVGIAFNKKYKKEVTIGSQIISKYCKSVM